MKWLEIRYFSLARVVFSADLLSFRGRRLLLLSTMPSARASGSRRMGSVPIRRGIREDILIDSSRRNIGFGWSSKSRFGSTLLWLVLQGRALLLRNGIGFAISRASGCDCLCVFDGLLLPACYLPDCLVACLPAMSLCLPACLLLPTLLCRAYVPAIVIVLCVSSNCSAAWGFGQRGSGSSMQSRGYLVLRCC